VALDPTCHTVTGTTRQMRTCLPLSPLLLFLSSGRRLGEAPHRTAGEGPRKLPAPAGEEQRRACSTASLAVPLPGKHFACERSTRRPGVEIAESVSLPFCGLQVQRHASLFRCGNMQIGCHSGGRLAVGQLHETCTSYGVIGQKFKGGRPG